MGVQIQGGEGHRVGLPVYMPPPPLSLSGGYRHHLVAAAVRMQGAQKGRHSTSPLPQHGQRIALTGAGVIYAGCGVAPSRASGVRVRGVGSPNQPEKGWGLGPPARGCARCDG